MGSPRREGRDPRTVGPRPEGGYQPGESRQGAPPHGGSGAAPAPPVRVEATVQAEVTRATPEAPPAPPRKKVYMCYGHPGITREITAENLVLNGPPFCTQCGIRMAEDLTGRL